METLQGHLSVYLQVRTLTKMQSSKGQAKAVLHVQVDTSHLQNYTDVHTWEEEVPAVGWELNSLPRPAGEQAGQTQGGTGRVHKEIGECQAEGTPLAYR